MTKSSAPVISSVRCPSARCARTRAKPSGNDRVSSWRWNSSHAVLPQLVDGRVLEAPVEGAQEVATVTPVEGEQGRRLAQQVGHEARPAGRAGGGGWPARRRCRPRWRP